MKLETEYRDAKAQIERLNKTVDALTHELTVAHHSLQQRQQPKIARVIRKTYCHERMNIERITPTPDGLVIEVR